VLDRRLRVLYDGAVPLSVSQDSKRGWIVVRASGVLDIEVVLRVIGTARATVENRMVPMLFDAREARGAFTDDDVERAVAAVTSAVNQGGMRGHVAIAALDDVVYAGMLRYETRCAEIGVRVIRVFRRLGDAESWLEAVSAARDLH
jgi:hypothetical protein